MDMAMIGEKKSNCSVALHKQRKNKNKNKKP
jgi:hypothetical protein